LPNGFTPEKTAELALHAAKNRKGECEHFAALESVLIKRLGYNAYCVSGLRLNPNNGSMGAHSWAMVEIDDIVYGFDPQYAGSFTSNFMSMFLITEAELRKTHSW
ncbi:MAG: transglutaminase-like domain-containing protein, partial [Oscillospiraceae bacterium]|jgi:transglutaminase-like putative cysteine protease|nr:transglutaminase-like domain-containing protein [Oscillospiraceae bacterium]